MPGLVRVFRCQDRKHHEIMVSRMSWASSVIYHYIASQRPSELNPSPTILSSRCRIAQQHHPHTLDLDLQTTPISATTRASRSLATTHPSSRPTSAVSHHHRRHHSVVRLPLPFVLPVVAVAPVLVVVVVSVKSVSSDQDVPPPHQQKKMSSPDRGRRYVSGHAALLYFSSCCYRWWWWWSSGLLVMVYCQVVYANGEVFHGKAYCSQQQLSGEALAPSCLSYPSDLLLLHPSLHDPHSQHHPRSDRGK
jgi:hypothetical protein